MSLDTHSPLPTPRGGPVSTPSGRTAPVRSTTAHVAFLAVAVAVALIGMVGVEVAYPGMADSSTPRLVQGVLMLVALAAWTGMVAEIVMEAIRDEKAGRS